MLKFTILHYGLRVDDKLKVEAFWRVYKLTTTSATSDREEASNQTGHGHSGLDHSGLGRSGPNIFWPGIQRHFFTF